MAGVALLGLTACGQPFDMDFRDFGNGFDTSEAVRQATAQRPAPDNRGVISYPTYQVAVASRGDTVTDVANRVGLPATELASFNGVPLDARLRDGEVLVLPRRVSEPTGATGAVASGPIQPGGVDVAALAGAAIDRSSGTSTPRSAPVVQTGQEPVRHRVERGETAFSIARLYNVSVRSLADWNGLGSDLAVREGQYLLIPVAAEPAPQPATAAPGTGSVAPEPPSAATPLPPPPTADREEQPEPESPAMSQDRTAASDPGRLAMPVSGSIVRPFKEGSSSGIGISTQAGAAVRAAGDGRVLLITKPAQSDNSGDELYRGDILVIGHGDNLLTVYSGIEGISVSKGDEVSRGQPIAKVFAGSPPVLHFEVREGSVAVDPMPYLK
jgi:murein DD-endopeptidase MepM/ murein hydrolase activator NlpD